MPEKFRSELNDEFVSELNCAICTAPALRVNHLSDYADYVSCTECGSSFVVEEDGERVLYGKISEDYSDTKTVVLKNWVTLDVVVRLASAERQRKGIAIRGAAASESEFHVAERLKRTAESSPEGPFGAVAAVDEPAVRQELAPVPSKDVADEPSKQAGEETAEARLVGERYRVRIKGESAFFPDKACAHCMKTPANIKLSISGSLPVGENPELRRRAVFGVPICAECRRKTKALSGAQKNARLQAHLTAMLVGLALVVAALGLGVVDISSNVAAGLSVLGIIGGLGYLLPLGLLLPRAQRAPPLRETYLILTTLRVRNPEEKIAESYFDFRNRDYAQLFLASNRNTAADALEEL